MEKNITTEEYVKMMSQREPDENCPVRKTLELLSGKWRTYVIFELSKKKFCRFGELKKAIPKITNTMLTSTLRDLEDIGIVNRRQFNEIPPHVEYSLTEKGRKLTPVFLKLQNGEKKIYKGCF